MSKSMTNQLSDVSQHLASIVEQSKQALETLGTSIQLSRFIYVES